jgi:hypothetical protein
MVQGTKVIALSNQVMAGSSIITVSGQSIRGSAIITISNQGTLTKDLADSITLTDSIIRETRFARLLADSVTMIDTPTREAVYNRTIPDSITLNDVIIKSISVVRDDTVTMSDGFSYVLNIIGGMALADALSLSDNIEAKAFSKVLSDSITLVDAVYPVDSAVLSQVINDSVTMSDSIISKQLTKVLSDTIILTDSRSNLVAIYPEDGVTITDSSSVTKLLQQLLDDSITLSDEIISTIISQPVVVPPKHRCALLDWLRRGRAFFHFTDTPLVTGTVTGNSEPTHTPVIPGIATDGSILSGTDLPPQGTNLDLGEHRG